MVSRSVRAELESLICQAADELHDATRWNQRDEADSDGVTPLDRLLDKIEGVIDGVLRDHSHPASAPRCQWCGRYAKGLMIYQPPTEVYKLEPDDPEGLCERCYDKANGR